MLMAAPAWALDASVLDHVVSVLPVWPGHARPGTGDPMADAPEASAVVLRDGGYLATAAHVVDRAVEIRVRLADGRVQIAELVAADAATDIAVLRTDAAPPPIEIGPEPKLADPVCAIGNAFGLGLSVTCGVVSATRRAGIGFNPIEDFVQTDAPVNPGMSGGALVDGSGRLVGLLSAIFTKSSDADIGVNFAVSTALLERVADDLIEHGRVLRVVPGFSVGPLDQSRRAAIAGVEVVAVAPEGAATAAGLEVGDVLLAVGDRPVRSGPQVTAAIQLLRPGQSVTLTILRDGEEHVLDLRL